MKIALIIYQYAPESGGVERQAGNLARGLIQRGHETHVIAKHIESQNGVVPRRVGSRSILPGGRHTAFARNVNRLIRSEKFDLVHSFTRTIKHDIIRLGGGTHREYLNRMESDRSGLDAWFSRINPKERAILNLEKKGFSQGHYKKIVAVSHRVKDEVIRHYGVREGNIEVIHNGVDLLRFNPELRETERPRIRQELGLGSEFTMLYCGTGFKRKGLRYAIDAAAQAEAKLLVVGGGDTTPYREQAERLKADVLFLGPRSNVEQLYASADLLIHPTLYDPFPNVCLEAMACGTPVLTTAVTGVAEIIEDGKNSFVVEDPRDVSAMVERIRKVRGSRKYGKAALATAEENPLQRMLDRNFALYENLLKSPV